MNGRRSLVEAWWPVLRSIGSFLLGSSILTWQTLFEDHPEPTLIAAACALIGLPAALGAQDWLRRGGEKP